MRMRYGRIPSIMLALGTAMLMLGLVLYVADTYGPQLATSLVATAAALASAFAAVYMAKTSAASVELLNIERRKLQAAPIELAERIDYPLERLEGCAAILQHSPPEELRNRTVLVALREVKSLQDLARELQPLIRVGAPRLSVYLIRLDRICAVLLRYDGLRARKHMRSFSQTLLRVIESADLVEKDALTAGHGDREGRRGYFSRQRHRKWVVADHLGRHNLS
ncbi:MAG TPA: hypothetical protein VFU06_06290 [Longimicrobiales bacterium]|nr:hypothetical protein [Longimicrobiales bacterium]